MLGNKINLRNSSLVSVLALAIAGTLTFAGCAAADEPVRTPTPEPVETTEPTPTPTPTPTPEPIALPTSCDVMNDTAFTEATEAIASLGLTATIDEMDTSRFLSTVGPVAQEAMNKAVQVSGCYYPVYFHNAVWQWDAELAAADQAPLVEALRADSTISESALGDATVFNYTQDPFNITYIFIDEVWVAILENGELDYGPAALKGVLAANPTLAAAG